MPATLPGRASTSTAASRWRDGAHGKVVGIRDVAREAGVSTATVSRVLERGTYPVKSDTREHVLAAVARLRYQPNKLARNLRTGRTNTVGVCAGVLNPSALSALDGILEAFRTAGRQVHVGISAWDPEQERQHLDRFYQERSDGVISYPVGASAESYTRLLDAGIPVVLLHRKVPGFRAPVVRHDFGRGYALAVRYLAGQGHQRIGALLPASPVSRAEHARAWRKACMSVGLAPAPELARHVDLESADVAAHVSSVDLLAGPNRPTAVVAASFAATLLAIRLAHQAGLRIGRDLDVVGGGDPRWGLLVTPPIPLLRVDAFRLGLVAAELLQARIVDPNATSTAQEVVVPIELVQPDQALVSEHTTAVVEQNVLKQIRA
jgi:LacI family transcriptional regulator